MTTDTPTPKLLAACYHEAGHALLAHIEEVPIKSVRAKCSGTGKVEPVDIEKASPEAVLRIARAGVAAEQIALGIPTGWDVNSDDGVLAHQAKLKMNGDLQEAEAAAVQHVETMLITRRQELDALATFICHRPNTTILWADIESELGRFRH